MSHSKPVPTQPLDYRNMNLNLANQRAGNINFETITTQKINDAEIPKITQNGEKRELNQGQNFQTPNINNKLVSNNINNCPTAQEEMDNLFELMIKKTKDKPQIFVKEKAILANKRTKNK